jgi:hypothetical protein
MAFPTARRFIERAEEKLGHRLPEALARRLLDQNGETVEIGDVVWWLHPVADDSNPKRFKRSWDDIVRQTERARRWRGFPPTAVSIADDQSGNRLILLPDGADASRLGQHVYDWDHETGGATRVATDIADLF